MAESQVLVFDKEGNDGVEIQAEVTALAWHDQQVTEARLTIPLTAANTGKLLFNHTLLKRMILIETENLPKWAGYIDTPIAFDHRKVTVLAKSGLGYLDSRFPYKSYDKEFTSGAFVHRMIGGAKQRGFLPVIALKESINTGGGSVGKVKRDNTILQNMKKLARRNNREFWLRPSYESGELRFYLYWRRNKQLYGDPIEVGQYGNAQWGAPAMTISGKIVTAWYVEERDLPTGNRNRKLIDTLLPRAIYGHWEDELVVDVLSEGDLWSPEFLRAVKNSGRPNIQYRLQVKIESGGISKQIEPGSIHELSGPGIGYTKGKSGITDTVRVSDVEYREGDGYLDVIARSWIDTDEEVLA